ncbi:hypothetical protein [Streptomyces olivaceus]|uniref:hypothetical protein n=1 Tax=Streptomyces olivaceus TaxID=47716 RepID=UPI0018852831|nr:hypothetical protein [Streptomyces olivaceus]
MKLLELAEAGDVPGVLRALGELTTDQRAAHAPALAAHFAALEAEEWRTLAEERRIALSTARLGCQVTPPTAADCILSPGFRAAFSADWMADVLDLYPAAWQAEVVARIDERATGTVMDGDRYAIIDYLVRVTGCPAPTASTYLNSWIRYWDHSALRTGKRTQLPRYGDMARILRDHHCAATFLPLILERPDVQLPPVSVLVELADEGLLDRAALVHRVLTEMADRHPAHALQNLEALRLTPEEHARTSPERVALLEPLLIRVLQDGTRKEMTPHLALLRALGFLAREQVSFLRDHVAMLDLSLPVAEYGQQVLVALDEAGLLEDDVLAESCERVLARPEKKLVRAQFSWLDRAARRDPGRAAGVVTGVALAFQHPDIALRERALTVAARHLRAAGEAVLPELRVAAAFLGPGLTARAEELFGPPPGDDGTAGRSTEAPPAAPFADVLPAVPVPARRYVRWGRPPRSPRRSPPSSPTATPWCRSNERWTGWSVTPASIGPSCPRRSARSYAGSRTSSASTGRATCTTSPRRYGGTSRGNGTSTCARTSARSGGPTSSRAAPRPRRCSRHGSPRPST